MVLFAGIYGIAQMQVQGFKPSPDPSQSTYVAPMPTPWIDPGFLRLLSVPSPNVSDRPVDAPIDLVVVHATVVPTLAKTVEVFCREKSQVSAHFVIGRDGSIVQQVSTFKKAWHAGVSESHDGRKNLNQFSVGIELVNLNDGKDPFPEAQTTALNYLIKSLNRRHSFKFITSHEFIARPKGRKNDPLNFPWQTLSSCGIPVVVK